MSERLNGRTLPGKQIYINCNRTVQACNQLKRKIDSPKKQQQRQQQQQKHKSTANSNNKFDIKKNTDKISTNEQPHRNGIKVSKDAEKN